MSEVQLLSHDVRGFSLAKTSYSLIKWLLLKSLDSTLLCIMNMNTIFI